MPSHQRDVISNFLEAYRDMPYLWNKTHEDYTNKRIRDAGYNVLLKIFKKVEPNMKVEMLKKKIDNMRTTYLREEKKVLAAKKTGTAYVPRLWYYDHLRFLGLPQAPVPWRQSSAPKDPLKYEIMSSSDDEEDEEESPQTRPARPTRHTHTDNKRKIKQSLDREEIISPPKEVPMKNEEWEILGKSIGLQLRDLDQKSLTITQKMISDVIYYAKMGKLSEASYIELCDGGTSQYQSLQQSGDDEWREEVLLESPSTPQSLTEYS